MQTEAMGDTSQPRTGCHGGQSGSVHGQTREHEQRVWGWGGEAGEGKSQRHGAGVCAQGTGQLEGWPEYGLEATGVVHEGLGSWCPGAFALAEAACKNAARLRLG